MFEHFLLGIELVLLDLLLLLQIHLKVSIVLTGNLIVSLFKLIKKLRVCLDYIKRY